MGDGNKKIASRVFFPTISILDWKVIFFLMIRMLTSNNAILYKSQWELRLLVDCTEYAGISVIYEVHWFIWLPAICTCNNRAERRWTFLLNEKRSMPTCFRIWIQQKRSVMFHLHRIAMYSKMTSIHVIRFRFRVSLLSVRIVVYKWVVHLFDRDLIFFSSYILIINSGDCSPPPLATLE